MAGKKKSGGSSKKVERSQRKAEQGKRRGERPGDKPVRRQKTKKPLTSGKPHQSTLMNAANQRLKFRNEQAELALTLLDSNLYGMPLKLAREIIRQFPTAIPATGQGRTYAARLAAVEALSLNKGQNKAIGLGYNRANKALTMAYSQLQEGVVQRHPEFASF